ncbi:2TM domain-containing protein [Aureisphaera galaxeae]|uniref:2TM domain-containing protein n=1 Tax=Aureisphaera galaxeae TaxID=1538023 RepID=UPI00234FCE51|nr:2TM domain-containing protein [Aureisphaera galaxeae]MDC8003344.1 2TM domain-containing protein [Aureisphaera galaxeae]
MFSKANKSSRIDPEQREQYEYARKRVKQKKRLMQHFVLFLAGSVLLIIINPILGIGKDFFIKDWFVWAILIWVLFFLIHLLNVLLLSKFMGKEWEDRQIEKLKAKQEARIAELEKEVRKDVITQEVRAVKEASADDLKKKEEHDLPPPEDL